MGKPDEVAKRVRLGYKLTIYPMVVKPAKQFMKVKRRGHAVSGSPSLSEVNGRKVIGIDGKTYYVTNAFEYRKSHKRGKR